MNTDFNDCYGDFIGLMKKDRRTLINNVASHLQLDIEQTKNLRSKFLDEQAETQNIEQNFVEPIVFNNETIREEQPENYVLEKPDKINRSTRTRHSVRALKTDGNERVSKNRNTKVDRGNKKLSSYNRYMQEQMQILKQRNPSVNQKDAFKIIASQWKKDQSENLNTEHQQTSNSEQEQDNMVLTKIRYSGNETYLLDKNSTVVYSTDSSNGKLFPAGEYDRNTKEITFY